MALGIDVTGTITGKLDSARLVELLNQAWPHTEHFGEIVADPQPPNQEDPAGAERIDVRFHPTAESVSFTLLPKKGLLGKRQVRVEARTSQVGPGYHAALVDMLKSLSAHGIAWPTSGVEGVDDTNYWATSDFAALGREMNAHVQALMRTVLAHYGQATEGMAIWMQLDATPASDSPSDAIRTPLGPKDLDWVRRAAADPAVAGELVIWLEQGLSARTLLQTALALMWERCPWAPPGSEQDGLAVMYAMACLNAARAADPTLAWPAWPMAEWHELREHYRKVGGDPDEFGPAPDAPDAGQNRPTIGYRRGLMRFSFGPDISLVAPGSMSRQPDETDETVLLADRGRTLRLSMFGLAPKPGSPPGARAAMAREVLTGGMEDQPEAIAAIRTSENNGHTRVWTSWQYAEEHEDYTVQLAATKAVISAGNLIAMVSCTNDLDGPYAFGPDVSWAEAVVRSITITADGPSA
jgi:hypothetical protein